MALRGSLDVVPVVDVLQFIHMASKSGTLLLQTPLGDAWVLFRDGRIVMARTPRTPSLGTLLVSQGTLDAARLEQLLERQRALSPAPPIGALAIDESAASREAVANAVQAQIQSAVVEISEWTQGEFTFDATVQGPADALGEIGLDLATALVGSRAQTTMFLLEAARVIDEVRQGGSDRPAASPESAVPVLEATPSQIVSAVPAPAPPSIPPPSEKTPALSPKRPPGAPRTNMHPGIVGGGLEPEEVVDTLGPLKAAGFPVLGHVPRASLRKMLLGRAAWPDFMVLVWRVQLTPEGALGGDDERLLSDVCIQHPGWVVVALARTATTDVIGRLYAAGVTSVLPMPPVPRGAPGLARALVPIVSRAWANNVGEKKTTVTETRAWAQARRLTLSMHRAIQRADVALELMRIASQSLERAVLFLAKGSELIGLGGFGSTQSSRPMAEALRGFMLEAREGSVIGRALADGRPHVSPPRQIGLPELFFDIAGLPAYDRAVVVPVAGPRKPVGLLYCDNGAALRPIQGIFAVDLAASQAGLAYENALLRLRLENLQKPIVPGTQT